ncbi:hypothetical protein [Thermaurantiacus sp.]
MFKRERLAALALFALVATPAAAGDQRFLVSPYLWFSAVESRLGTPIGTIGTEASFGDIISNLDFGFMGTLEYRRGRLGLIGDVIYMNLGTSRDLPGEGGVTRADGRLKQLGGTGYVAWRAGDLSFVDIDLLGGFRVFSIDTSVELDARGQGGPGFAVNETWVDPVLGARVSLQLSDRWTATGLVDVGGFGVGSEISWQGLVTIGYRISGSVSAQAGYRHLDFDRQGRSFRLEQSLSGPLLGLTIGF